MGILIELIIIVIMWTLLLVTTTRKLMFLSESWFSLESDLLESLQFHSIPIDVQFCSLRT